MKNNKKLSVDLKKFVLLFILIGLAIVFGIMSPKFLTFNNIMNIITQNSYLIIASIGVALVMISGGTDLSVGYQISVVGVCTAIFMQWLNMPIILSIFLGLVISIVLGSINGFTANKLNMHPMIVTLATMTLFQGISFLISQSKSIYDLAPSFKVIGQGYVGSIPIPVIIVLVIALIIGVMLKKTYFGRHIYAVGGNPEAAHLAGIDVKKVKLLVFALCGLLVGIAAVVLISRTGSANSSMGPGTEFNAITACVLGGVSFIGGEGDIDGVVIGVLILGVLSNGMQLIGLGIYIQYVAKALILIAAIAFDTYQKQTKVKKNVINNVGVGKTA